MKPMITMTQEALVRARVVAQGDMLLWAILRELDAQRSVQPQAVFISNEQRAETPREPDNDGSLVITKLDPARVRQEAIDQAIQKVFEASFLVQHSDKERCYTDELVKSLEALRDQPGARGAGD